MNGEFQDSQANTEKPCLEEKKKKKKARLQTLKRKNAWQGSNWQVMPHPTLHHVPSKAPRQQGSLGMDREP